MRFRSSLAAVPLVVALGASGAPGVSAQQPGQHGAVYTPDKLEWKKGPPSLPAGAEFVVIEGDPSKAEFFAMRLRLPDGYRVPPHWHPVHERVTVISGTFHLGQGEKFDAKATQALKAGSYFTMPPEMRHFARAEGETVVQLNSVGPWEIRYVDSADDPRRATGR